MTDTTESDSLITWLCSRTIETQSWGYVSTGTRFKVHHTPGTPRTVWEKVDDAALVHRLTGVTPSLALHIPWDAVDDYRKLGEYAAAQGLRIGSISPNLFQDDDYRLGSLAHSNAGIRDKAVGHVLDCIEIMAEVGSTHLSLWLADGTNYPGQDNFRNRTRLLHQSLARIMQHLPTQATLMLEYKFFEPAFYHTDVADWGQSLMHCEAFDERAKVLVDIGHHPLGTNIEHIVATLLDRGRLGGFDLNSKKYGDDDLFVGAINPQETFLICAELLAAENDPDPAVHMPARDILYKIDQCAMIEQKIPAMLHSVDAIQTAFAKALLIDRAALSTYQAEGDVVMAHRTVNDAFLTDVRPLLAQARDRLGVPTDPLRAYLESEAPGRLATQRVGTPAGW